MIGTPLGTLLPLLEPLLHVIIAVGRSPADPPGFWAWTAHQTLPVTDMHSGLPVLAAANSLPAIIGRARVWIMALLGSIATLFLILGGVRYLTAGGDPGEVERAKSALKSALIGYALALIAPLLLTVLQSIVGEKP